MSRMPTMWTSSPYSSGVLDEYFSCMQCLGSPMNRSTLYYRTYALLDEYPDTMVTPSGAGQGGAGLQYRFGVTRATRPLCWPTAGCSRVLPAAGCL